VGKLDFADAKCGCTEEGGRSREWYSSGAAVAKEEGRGGSSKATMACLRGQDMVSKWIPCSARGRMNLTIMAQRQG
jgi:hypothetical protein